MPLVTLARLPSREAASASNRDELIYLKGTPRARVTDYSAEKEV
jgi:hypothetical protein